MSSANRYYCSITKKACIYTKYDQLKRGLYSKYVSDSLLRTCNCQSQSGGMPFANAQNSNTALNLDLKPSYKVFDISNNINYKIFPNPAKEEVFVIFNSDVLQSIQLKIIDQSGKQVYQNVYPKNVGFRQLQIPVNNLSQGLYQISITIDGKTTTSQLSVVK